MNYENINNSENSSKTNSMDLVFKGRKKNRKCIRMQREKIDRLKAFFQKNPYPKKEDFEIYGTEVNELPTKVENWFKYQRRMLKSTNLITKFKERKILSKESLKILQETFRNCTKPQPAKYHQLSKQLNCDLKSIKKWFSYRRRKLSFIQKSKVKIDASVDSFDILQSADNESLSETKKRVKQYKKPIKKDQKINFSNRDVKKEYRIKSENNGESSSVFYTSNEDQKKQSNSNANSESSCFNSNKQNDMIQNNSSDSNENNPKLSSNPTSRHSLTKTKSTSNLNYKIETLDKPQKGIKKINSKNTFKEVGSKNDSKCSSEDLKGKQTTNGENHDSNYSSGLQKVSEDSEPFTNNGFPMQGNQVGFSEDNFLNQMIRKNEIPFMNNSNSQDQMSHFNINYRNNNANYQNNGNYQQNNENCNNKNNNNNAYIPVNLNSQMNVGYPEQNSDKQRQNTVGYQPIYYYNGNMRNNNSFQPQFSNLGMMTNFGPSNMGFQIMPNFMQSNYPNNNNMMGNYCSFVRPMQNMYFLPPRENENRTNFIFPNYYICQNMPQANENNTYNCKTVDSDTKYNMH